MATEKANYGGGTRGNMCEGLQTRSKPVYDKSREAIGKKFPTSVNVADRPDEVGEARPPTLGPRAA